MISGRVFDHVWPQLPMPQLVVATFKTASRKAIS